MIDPLSVCSNSNGSWRGNDKGGLKRDRDTGGEEWNDSTDTPVNKPPERMEGKIVKVAKQGARVAGERETLWMSRRFRRIKDKHSLLHSHLESSLSSKFALRACVCTREGTGRSQRERVNTHSQALWVKSDNHCTILDCIWSRILGLLARRTLSFGDD